MIRDRAPGWKWLALRRVSQFGILALFLAGPIFGVWIAKGNLNYSLTLDTLPLADPYVLAQSLLAQHVPETKALVGAAIVLVLYLVVGGRAYCSWVCPMNVVTDVAAWLRRRLGIRTSGTISRNLRYWILAMTLVLAAGTGTIAWELANPVSMLHRGLVFGMGAAWAVVGAIFLFDLFVSLRGWCGHVCPVGAFYGLLGRASLVRVAARNRAACDDCRDCYVVCPEPQVLTRPLRGAKTGASPVISDGNCTNCGRCIDVCHKDVFAFGTRSSATAGTLRSDPRDNQAKETP